MAKTADPANYSEQEQQNISEDELRLLFDNMISPFSYYKMVYDAEGQPVDYVFLAVNKAFEQETGMNRAQIIGKNVLSIYPETETYWIECFCRVAKTGVSEHFTQYAGALNKWYSVLAYSPKPEHVAITIADISQYMAEREVLTQITQQLKKQQDENYRLAHEEPITGLPNRACLYEAFEGLIQGERKNEPFSITIFTPDNLAEILASYGSLLSDRIMRAIAQRLAAIACETESLYSMTGTDFVLLVTKPCDHQQMKDILARYLRTIRAPVEIDTAYFRISASCGIACYPSNGTNRDDLIMKANLALYQAKRGGSPISFYSAPIEQTVLRRTQVRNALPKALENQEFELYFQPQVELKNSRLVGFEALLRWHSTDLGEISPLEFIEVAEESRLILPLGNWVLKTACETLLLLEERFQTPFRMAVNVSGAQLQQGGFFERVQKLLRVMGIGPDRLELEITESVLFKHTHESLKKLNRLRAGGVRIALDDFGTGYSTMSLLKDFKVTTLKIDRSFVQDESASVLTEVMVRLGHTLGAQIVAEGVETQAQLERVRSIGCDIEQGFLESRPLPLPALIRYIEARFARESALG